MTLTEAKTEIQIRGALYGDVLPLIEEHNRAALAEWFVRAEGVPNLVARDARQALPSGNLCRCGGMMVRTGTCETCSSCGESSGGCG